MQDGVEVRVTSETGGQKGTKLAQLGALDPDTLLTLAKIAGFGADKYDAHNFLKGYDWSLSFNAAQRHMLAFWSGENLDPESGLPHLGHAAWNCLTMLAFLQRDIGTDDRPSEENLAKLRNQNEPTLPGLETPVPFKVGDRVRLTAAVATNCEGPSGHQPGIYAVGRVWSPADSAGDVGVQWDGRSYEHYVDAALLELIQ